MGQPGVGQSFAVGQWAAAAGQGVREKAGSKGSQEWWLWLWTRQRMPSTALGSGAPPSWRPALPFSPRTKHIM